MPSRRQRRASSDMDESDAEEDRLEAMLARHQQRNVSDWGSSGSGTMSPRKRRRGQQPGRSSQLDPDQSFEMDTTGTGINSVSSIPTAAAEAPLLAKRAGGLLLPGHVEILPEEEDGRGDDNVGDCKDTNAEGEMGDFVLLDGDRSGQAARYWEVEEQEQRKALEECPTCGEKGHDKRSCPHLQCLACGALDKHSTRECPMGLNCFRCGGRGHKALECKMPRTQGAQGWRECRRCGAPSHVESNCPTLWRIYSYRSSEENLAERHKKFGAREANHRGAAPPARFDYRSESESDQDDKRARSPADPPRDWDPAERWCYNCAAGGNHWGDDCPLPRCNPTRTGGDPSPYSEYLASSGPHARHLPPPPPPDPYAYREGLRSRDGFDRFEAGPGASMHVYDPQREAMKSVDQLFDRHGPGASRQRDAARRRGERDVESLRPKPVERRSGEGSKAERYREAERERGSERERRRRGEDRPIQVSANEPPAPLLAPNNATLTNGRGSEDDVVSVSAKETDGRMTKAQAKQERRREKMAKKREKRQRKKADLRDRLEKEEEFRRTKKARTGQAVIEVDDSDYEDSGGSDSDDDSSDQGKAASAQKAEKHRLTGSKEQSLPAERRQLRSMDGARTKLERASGEAEAREKDKSEARQFMKQWTPASMAAEAKEQDKVKRKRNGPLVEAGIADSVKVDRPTSTKKAKTDRNRALMKEQYDASQARRLASGKVEEHAEREKTWLEMEASWMAKDARDEKKANKATKAAEAKAKAKRKKRAAQVAPPRQPRLADKRAKPDDEGGKLQKKS